MVLDLIVEPAEQKIAEAAWAEVPGGDNLCAEEVHPIIFAEYLHAIMVRGEDERDVQSVECMVGHEEEEGSGGGKETEEESKVEGDMGDEDEEVETDFPERSAEKKPDDIQAKRKNSQEE